MNTKIQLITVKPYIELVVLPFLYDKPKDAELYIDRERYVVDNIRDKIDIDGSITRLIRVFKVR
jgi:hypothetical protein